MQIFSKSRTLKSNADCCVSQNRFNELSDLLHKDFIILKCNSIRKVWSSQWRGYTFQTIEMGIG